MASTQLSPSFSDREDFENATRGLVGRLEPCVVKASDGRLIWDNDAYNFLQGECPSTANPKLWRQGQLNSIQGLFKVVEGIYQIRGFDISNMTVVEGQTGVIVIDPLISAECAAAALKLYREHRGDRKVTGLIYSHSHADHFGGAQGVLTASSADDKVPIIAPDGFMEEATSENVFAGPSMARRAVSMYGTILPKGPTGQIGCGLGMAASLGNSTLIPPTMLIKSTGEEHTIDGVRIVFQMVPGTEAPSEMNFHFPAHRALCIAECATHCLHNIITLRGAQVRDAKAWSRYLDESIVLYGDSSDVQFGSHNWPTWGRDKIVKMLADQRDVYAYMHDQTVRLMNTGMTGVEIAEVLTLPPALQQAWYAQGYYGSLSHNVKGIYQRYMTWFDGNPAHLWQYPPTEEGKRYVACFGGGIDELVTKAQQFATEGDARFAATLLGHAVAAEPTHAGARQALASVFETLGFGAENATWRNFYLTGALVLRSGKKPEWSMPGMNSVNPGLSVEQWFAGLSVEIDGPRAARESFEFDLTVTDTRERWRLIVSNGVLTYRKEPWGEADANANAVLVVTKSGLRKLLQGEDDIPESEHKGDVTLMKKLVSLGKYEPGTKAKSMI